MHDNISTFYFLRAWAGGGGWAGVGAQIPLDTRTRKDYYVVKPFPSNLAACIWIDFHMYVEVQLA